MEDKFEKLVRALNFKQSACPVFTSGRGMLVLNDLVLLQLQYSA